MSHSPQVFELGHPDAVRRPRSRLLSSSLAAAAGLGMAALTWPWAWPVAVRAVSSGVDDSLSSLSQADVLLLWLALLLPALAAVLTDWLALSIQRGRLLRDEHPAAEQLQPHVTGLPMLELWITLWIALVLIRLPSVLTEAATQVASVGIAAGPGTSLDPAPPGLSSPVIASSHGPSSDTATPASARSGLAALWSAPVGSDSGGRITNASTSRLWPALTQPMGLLWRELGLLLAGLVTLGALDLHVRWRQLVAELEQRPPHELISNQAAPASRQHLRNIAAESLHTGPALHTTAATAATSTFLPAGRRRDFLGRQQTRSAPGTRRGDGTLDDQERQVRP